MQSIEPFYLWRDFYTAENDERSPFYGNRYSEFEYSNTIYNHYIHPQWNSIESDTLFVKVLFVDYEEGYAFIELFGEWNDMLYNDIMLLKQNLLELLIAEGVNKLIFIGRNVLNFHGGDDDYYEELTEELEDGWIIGLQFPEHLIRELRSAGIQRYIDFHTEEDHINHQWATKRPEVVYRLLMENYLD
ncbi:MAG: hypothetical protein H6600_04115 [Flavobacteriales bacterium]|nr:hypothetical protein [Flavobacteriales bacterium]MCB9197619.1 hypothetical protein [Flavobacteriales bacterium]